MEQNSLPTPPSLPNNLILRRLLLAGWIVIALLSVTLFLVNVVANFYEMATPCEGALGFVEGCNSNAVSSAEIAILTSRGITLRAYSLGMSIAPLLNLLLYCTLAGLILWRQGNSWLGRYRKRCSRSTFQSGYILSTCPLYSECG